MLITKCLTRHVSHFLILLSFIKHVQLLSLTFGNQNSEILSKEPEDGLLALSVQEMRQRPKGKLYFAIAAPAGSQTYTRAFNKTLFNITQNYILKKVNKERYNITLDTLTIDLPENGTFSAKLLQKVCDLFDGKHVVAVLVIGDSPAAFMVSYAAKHAAVPVLLAREHSRMLTEFENSESSFLEVQLTPEGRELVQALRGLLLQAHWHTYTLLANEASATALRRPDLWAALASAPLHPTLVALPNMPQRRPTTVFRKLADISRLTRGVIVLFSDRVFGLRILENARRLNMMDGHFVWIWINTASTTAQSELYSRDPDQELNNNVNYSEFSFTSDSSRFKRASNANSKKKSDTSDTHQLSFLSNNDDSLINFDHNEGVESSKLKNRQEPLEKVPVSKRDYAAITSSDLPVGILSLRPLPIRVDRHLVKGAVKLLVVTLKQVLDHCPEWLSASILHQELKASCWRTAGVKELNFSTAYARELRSATADALAGKRTLQENSVEKVDKSLVSSFEILNLVPELSSKQEDHATSNNKTGVDSVKLKWKRVGLISGRSVRLDTIIWPGGDLSVAAISANARSVFRIVTALSPPFVMESELDEDGQCLRGLPCHRVLTHDKDNLTLVFHELDRLEEEHEESKTFGHFGHFQHLASSERFHPFYKYKYRTNCCYGLSMDLLENIAHELEFDFHLYIVADGLFGSKVTTDKKSRRDLGRSFWVNRLKKEEVTTGDAPSGNSKVEVKWNGIVGDLISEAAHMSFAALSVSSVRSEVIDFSVPYFFAGVSSLAAPQQKSDIPLMAFLLPFSTELWIAIFTSLNITAIAVAIYEWLSPFGLNPWGRQRSKNFSMSSALWVMWGLLCGHLVAFKAPKSWPNKFLINVWGGFSVIFVASYTANIAALIAGLFFRNTGNYYDRTFLNQRVGAPRASAAEYYVQKADPMLWEHMLKYSLKSIEEGIERLRNGTLDIVIADTPILDYYRATDHLCKLQKIGTVINEDTYAVGMTKGFPLRDSISAVIAKYASNGYLDILQEKWYGGLPCFKVGTEALAQPKPLGFAAVTGVFILLGVGMILGLLILLLEHLFFRYTLPILRDKPKNSLWRSRNIMFFSQKLYRFINCVELVSPHHAARELVHTIRQGQITSLFQKSVKRKEHEQRRRRRSKAQFFEMIQEIRSSINRQQQESRPRSLECVTEDTESQLTAAEKKSKLSPSILRRTFMRTSPITENPPKLKSPTTYFNKQFFSPRTKAKPKTASTLNVRRFSSDSVFSSQTLHTDRSSSVGRRLSKDVSCLSNSPPDINSRRSSYLDTVSTGSKLAGKSPVLSIENVSVCSARVNDPQRKLSDAESIGKKLATLPLYVGEPFNKQHLHPQYSATLGKSDQTLNKPEKRRASRTLSFDNQTTKSYQNISDSEREGNSNALLRVSCEEKSNLSDDEIARRNRLTIEQLQQQLVNKRKPAPTSNNSKQTFKTTTQPPIIQVEDTSQKPAVIRRHKTRHQSLGDATSTSTSLPRKKKLEEQSHSLDGNPSMTKNRRRCHEHDLPPAPPPPNCSPRNSDGGKSPLDRLSKDELVNLWRSSESELRSHILKAIRDKETVDPP